MMYFHYAKIRQSQISETSTALQVVANVIEIRYFRRFHTHTVDLMPRCYVLSSEYSVVSYTYP